LPGYSTFSSETDPADGSADKIRDHRAPWGIHRQGGFIDPFGHLWLVGGMHLQFLLHPCIYPF
jgi:hypothetical protein